MNSRKFTTDYRKIRRRLLENSPQIIKKFAADYRKNRRRLSEKSRCGTAENTSKIPQFILVPDTYIWWFFKTGHHFGKMSKEVLGLPFWFHVIDKTLSFQNIFDLSPKTKQNLSDILLKLCKNQHFKKHAFLALGEYAIFLLKSVLN